MLLQKGADADAKDTKGATPLHCAANKGNLRCVQVLLKDSPEGKRANARTGQGLTPLHSAAKSGRNECILVLLVAGATIDAKSNRGLTPCDMAAGTSRPDVVRLLLGKGASMNRKGWQHYKLNSIWPALIDVCSAAGFGGATATLDALKKLRNGELHEVARRGDLRRARYLLVSQGADPNFPDAIGQTPLHEACLYGHNDMVWLLMDHHASPMCKDKKLSTPLHVACGSGNVECARSLLSTKSHSVQSQINSQTMNGLTPLHSAAKAGRLGAVELLLSQGAASTVNATTKDRGETCVDLAAANGLQLDVIRLLQYHGGHLTNDRLRASVSLGFSLPHLFKCVRGGLLMDAQDIIWRWRLMAGKTGQLHIVSRLVWFASSAIRVQLTSACLHLLYFRKSNALNDSDEAHTGRIVLALRAHIRHVCAMTIQHLLAAARWHRITSDFASHQGALFFLKRVVRSHTSQMYYSAWKQWTVAISAVGRVTNFEVRATEQRATVAQARELELGQLKQRATTFDIRVSATRCCAAVLVAGIVASRKAALWFRWRAAALHLKERCLIVHSGCVRWGSVVVGSLFRRWSTYASTSWQMKARAIIEKMFASRRSRYCNAFTLWQMADLTLQNRLAQAIAETAFSQQADVHVAFKTEMAQTVGRMSRELEIATKIADKVMGKLLVGFSQVDFRLCA
jgi:ankyrin repeat protein